MDGRARLMRATAGAALVLATALATGRTAFAVVTPNSTADDNVTNGNCTLREAIRSINEKRKVDTCNWTSGETQIQLSPGTYNISSSVGDVAITAGMRLLGAGHRVTILDFGGGAGAQAFAVALPASSLVMFTDLTMKNSSGSAVRVEKPATVLLTKVKISHMGSLFNGGACVKVLAGSAILDNSEIADCQGTGVVVAAGASADISHSTITRSQGERGGAIQNAGTLTMELSTLGNNTSTVYGAGVLNLGSATIYGSTIAHNRSGTSGVPSGALHNSTGATMSIQYSIIANNTNASSPSQASCYQQAAITSRGYNVIGEGCPTGIATDVTGDPDLARDSANSPLAAGGVGTTYVPSLSSVAVGKVPLSQDFCFSADQRDLARSHGSHCDIGAVERPNVLLVTASPPQPGDYVLSGMLFTLGANITTVSDTASRATDANGKALVVISESVTSANVNTKFRDTATPILNLEPYLVDDLKMTAPTADTDYGLISSSGLVMTGTRGPTLAVPNRFGIVDIAVSNILGSSQNMGWTHVPSGASPVISARSSADSSKKLIMKYAAGNAMYGGFIAPGPRTSFFATDAALQNTGPLGQALLLEVMAVAAGM